MKKRAADSQLNPFNVNNDEEEEQPGSQQPPPRGFEKASGDALAGRKIKSAKRRLARGSIKSSGGGDAGGGDSENSGSSLFAGFGGFGGLAGGSAANAGVPTFQAPVPQFTAPLFPSNLSLSSSATSSAAAKKVTTTTAENSFPKPSSIGTSSSSSPSTKVQSPTTSVKVNSLVGNTKDDNEDIGGAVASKRAFAPSSTSSSFFSSTNSNSSAGGSYNFSSSNTKASEKVGPAGNNDSFMKAAAGFVSQQKEKDPGWTPVVPVRPTGGQAAMGDNEDDDQEPANRQPEINVSSNPGKKRNLSTIREGEGVDREFRRDLKNLNESVVSWTAEHVLKDPYVDFTAVFQEYGKHLAAIDRKHKRNHQQQQQQQKGSSKSTTSAVSFPSFGGTAAQSSKNSTASSSSPMATFGFSSKDSSDSGNKYVTANAKKTTANISEEAMNKKAKEGTEKTSEKSLKTASFSFGLTAPSSVISDKPPAAASKEAEKKGEALPEKTTSSSISGKFMFGGPATTTTPSSTTTTTTPSFPTLFGQSSSDVSSLDNNKKTEASDASKTGGLLFGGPPKTSSSGGFSFGLSPASSTTPLNPSAPSFAPSLSSGAFSFGNVAGPTPAAGGDSAAGGVGGEEPYVPPKPEVTAVQEPDAFYEKRCKLFIKKDSGFVSHGVGNLFLKKTDAGKTQLLIRADTNLGNVLLNIAMNDTIPVSVTKNNVNLFCVPNPALDPPKGETDEDKEKRLKTPVPMLVRVKTEIDAEELKDKIKKSA